MRERGIALLIIVAIVVVAVVVIIGVLGVYFLTKGGTQVTNVELSPVNDGIYLGFQATVYGIGEEVYLRVYDPSGSQIADGFVQPTISGSTKTIRSFFSSHRTCNFGGSPGGTYRLTAELFGGEGKKPW